MAAAAWRWHAAAALRGVEGGGVARRHRGAASRGGRRDGERSRSERSRCMKGDLAAAALTPEMRRQRRRRRRRLLRTTGSKEKIFTRCENNRD
uniref:Uncharacterized protein n=1 Tax=Oryza sativa subsp. japonica TaxID=39947 RepID=Q5Z5I8_ORYSJ|nr:hypothetical protein [Oryza sativa Japonica Group]